MLVGMMLMKMNGSAYYSPEFERGGNAANFTCDVLQLSAAPTLNIDIEHKNFDDTSWTVAASFPSMNSVILTGVDASGLKELLRFKYTVSGFFAYSAVFFNLLAPQWRP